MCKFPLFNRLRLMLSGILLFVFSLLLLSFTTPAGSYVYVNPESVSDLTPYTEALSKADMDRYRYMDERNTIV
ncbi:MAG: hypothetical protein ACK5Z2_07940, partial [Bacteroidota bacterium]